MPLFDSNSKIPTPGNDDLDSHTPELDVAIVGGGISGLVTAYRLATRPELGCNALLRLFEASDRLGVGPILGFRKEPGAVEKIGIKYLQFAALRIVYVNRSMLRKPKMVD